MSQSSARRPGSNGSRFLQQADTAEDRADTGSSTRTTRTDERGNRNNTRVPPAGAGENAQRAFVSRLPLAAWRSERSASTVTACRDDATTVQDGRRTSDVSRLPASPASATTTTTTTITHSFYGGDGWVRPRDSRDSDFCSVPFAAFHQSDDETAIGRRQQQSSCDDKPEPDRFKWSGDVLEDRRLRSTRDDGNGDKGPPSHRVAADKLEKLAASGNNTIKKQEVVDAYTEGLKEAPEQVKGGPRTSSYINRKAKEKEAARINGILFKKLLNVKSTMSSRR